MTITFRFKVKDFVKTPLGEKGFVTNVMSDGSKNSCYVETKAGGSWLDEEDLELWVGE